MERLNTSLSAGYSALEASIHVGRYALARNLSKDRHVLDIACGEGYGSYLLALWGARSVKGVDASAEAIHAARARFNHSNVEFDIMDVAKASAADFHQKFGLIVCFETFEHMRDPVGLMSLLRDVSSKDGIIIVSCPNDHWYYKDEQGNPWHTRKYTFEEFRIMAEKELGPAASWRMGTALGGFINVPIAVQRPRGGATPSITDVSAVDIGVLVPSQSEILPTVENCAYFVGVWGDSFDTLTSAAFPISMDGYKKPLFGGSSYDELARWRDELDLRDAAVAHSERNASQNSVSALARKRPGPNREKVASRVRELGLQLHISLAENNVLRQSLTDALKRVHFLEDQIIKSPDKLDM